MSTREYLKNPICNFTPLFPIDYNKKQNIISACFFKMESSGYKDFSKYTDGIKKLSNTIRKLGFDYSIRLFIDNSIYSDKKIFDEIKNLWGVQPVLYSCPNYIIKDDYHIGLFGTIVRFFPFFDFANNDANFVISADIDETNIGLIKEFTNLYTKYKSDLSDTYLLKSGPLNRSIKYKFNSIFDGKFNPYVFALSYASIKRIDSTVLTDFFIQISEPSNSIIYSQHYLINDEIESKEYNSKYNNSHGKFIYGIDEYFLNYTLTKYMIKNKLSYAVQTKWNVFGCLYYVIEKTKLSSKQTKLLNLIFKYIYKKLNWDFSNLSTPHENFEKLDRIIYSKNESDKKKAYEINFLVYKLFLYFKNNSNYKFLFPSEYYELFVDDEKYFGTYDLDFVRIIHYDKNDKDIVFEFKKFNSDDIEKLQKFYSTQKNKK